MGKKLYLRGSLLYWLKERTDDNRGPNKTQEADL